MSLVGKQSNYWKLWPVWLPGSTRAASPGYPAAAPENLANWCLFGVSDPLKEGEGAVVLVLTLMLQSQRSENSVC